EPEETTAAETASGETTATETDPEELTSIGKDTYEYDAYDPKQDDPYSDFPMDDPYAYMKYPYDEDPFSDVPFYNPDIPYDPFNPGYDPYDPDNPYYNPYDEKPYYDPYDPYDPKYNPYAWIYPYYDPSDKDAVCACGDNITWRLENDTLYLEGYGPMWDMNERQKENHFDNVVYWSSYDFNVTNVVFDDRITEISPYAFYCNDKIEHIEFPAMLEKIGEGAFQDCINLLEQQFPKELKEIGKKAFYNTRMPKVVLPASVIKLDESAFAANSRLYTVEMTDYLEYIGKACFKDCTSLVDIKVPDTVKYVGSNVFDGCVAWFRNQRDDFSILGDGFLYKYLGTGVNVRIPDTVKHICNDAFTEQSEESTFSYYYDSEIYLVHEVRRDIEMIIVPDSVKDIPAGCFQDLSGLQTVVLPDTLTEIPPHAFSYCENLDHLVLPDTVKTIGLGAFASCSSLSDILIPDSVENVARDAFKGTPFLQGLGEYAVIGDGLLVSYQGKDSILTVPEGIKVICSDAILMDNVTEITFPSTLRKILDSGVRSRSLVKVNMNEGLEEIGNYGIVFSDACRSFRLPDSVTKLEEDSIRASCLRVIYGSEKSVAKEYAALRGVRYETEEQIQSGPDMTLDLKTDVWSFGNNGEYFDDEYYLTERDRDLVEGFINPRAKAFPDSWSGDCFGLALTVVLAKNGQLPAAAFQEGAKNLHDLVPDKAVQSLINYYHCVQYTDKYIRANVSESKAQRFYRMVQAAESITKGSSPFLISFQTAEYAHAVVGYGVEHGSWQFNGKKYDSRILIWDPNFPGYLAEDVCLYYDKISFSYCIPHYDIYVERLQGSIGILQVLNDLSVLNAYPYPYELPDQPVYDPGDVNGDGLVTVADAVMLARIAAEDTTLKCSQEMVERADLDNSSTVTLEDCTILLKMLANIKDKKE
ncbi:MAG: leucine-rich repeat protein, partial [Oscillospiraceae bacterium]|nr:leucine-rich repeat protein [Oscillospiraceae bacterium]